MPGWGAGQGGALRGQGPSFLTEDLVPLTRYAVLLTRIHVSLGLRQV